MTSENDEQEECLTPEEMDFFYAKILIYLQSQGIALPDNAELLIDFSDGEIRSVTFTEGEPMHLH